MHQILGLFVVFIILRMREMHALRLAITREDFCCIILFLKIKYFFHALNMYRYLCMTEHTI
jgi:hypothetical protein